MEVCLDPSSYQERRLQQLFDECRDSVINQIIGPFGLSIAMFDDKDGGGVNTIHNVRGGVYASDVEKQRYNERGEYISTDYHADPAYINKNRENSEKQDRGQLVDDYTGNKVSINTSMDLDHSYSAKNIHDDPGRVLAGIEGKDLANKKTNLHATNSSINRSKGAKTMDQFIKDWEKGRGERQAKITELSSKDKLSDKECKELKKLKSLEEFSPDEAKRIADGAKKQYDKQVNNRYYTSGKFAKSMAKDAASTAVRTAIQQALGSVLIEFAKASFTEMKLFIRERKDSVINIFEDISSRLRRVMDRVIAKLRDWKEIATDLKDGLLSGLLASLTTTLVNVFATTAKRFVRAIREGFRSIVQAFKLLFFRPIEMTEDEALKLAVKALAGVVVTTIGIVAETSINSFLQTVPVVGQFASIVTPVLIGIVSGIGIALISYYVDSVFRIFQLSEENFKCICQSAALQENTMIISNKVAEQIIQMGNCYVDMIESNILLSKKYENINSLQLDFLHIQSNVSYNYQSSIGHHGATLEMLKLSSNAEMLDEFLKTEEWLKSTEDEK